MAKRFYLLVPLLVLTLNAASSAVPGGLKIVANPAVRMSEISADELRSIFLGTTTSLKETGAVRPVLSKEGANLNLFATGYLGKTTAALETYYRSLMFTGRWSMPVAFSTDAEAIDYIAKTPGAIGFVKDTAKTEQVKTLKVK